MLLPQLSAAQSDRGPANQARKASRGPRTPAERYTIAQATSDKAQINTVAFSGLAFLTGDFGASTFLPPGKVCDFFGFQYMRDIDAASKGHNPMFLNRVVGNVLEVLTDEQETIFQRLAEQQAPQLEALARARYPVIRAFHANANGEVPAGKTLGRSAVESSVAAIFERDALLSYERAQAMAAVWRSLSDEQKARLATMKFGDFATWPARDERDAKRPRNKGTSQLQNVAFMTYASEFFSWTAGSVEADTYFCPERHGTYFGGFYMKDMPAMGKRDYDISTTVTGDSGETFLRDVLRPEQRQTIERAIAQQKQALAEIVEVRRAISKELRKFLTNEVPDRERVRALGHRYGELDGGMSWAYAMAFAVINRTLTPQQREAMTRLRNLPGYISAPCYVYSRPGQAETASPDITGLLTAATAERAQ